MKSISVIIPLYKSPDYIKRAISSVLDQEVLPDEIIVVDDGSPYGGGDGVRTFKDARIKYISQKNQGVSIARNQGISLAQGEFIAFLDDDDYWHPGYLKEILALIDEFPQAGLYATAYKTISPYGTQKNHCGNVLPEGRSHGLLNYFTVALDFPIFISGVVVRKVVLNEVGGFERGVAIDQDVDLWLRIALRFPIAWSNRCLVTYDQTANHRVLGSARWGKEPVVSFHGRQALVKGMVPPDQVDDLKEYLAHFQLAAARDCLVQGHKETALQLLSYARGTRKFLRQWWQWRFIAALPGNPGPWLWRLKQSSTLLRK